MRIEALALAVTLTCAGAEEPPPAPGVSVEIRAERTEFAIGDPILVDVVYRNEGDRSWEVEEPHVIRFYDPFEVRDSEGVALENPYADVDSPCYDGPVTVHKLPPEGTVTLRQYLNESAAFKKPGEYVVTARGPYFGGFRCASRPLRIKILPAPDRAARTTNVALLKALWQAPALLEREAYARYRPYIREHNGSWDALRLLAFLRDPDLIPFWIARLGDRRSAFAPEALAGMPDRAAVLKALEERLERGVEEGVLTVYVLLAVPDAAPDAFARRKEIRERYGGR